MSTHKEYAEYEITEVYEVEVVVKRSVVGLYNEVVSFVRERKRVPVGLVATRFGFSRHYFKYSVLKAILEMYSDIRVVRENGLEYIVSEG